MHGVHLEPVVGTTVSLAGLGDRIQHLVACRGGLVDDGCFTIAVPAPRLDGEVLHGHACDRNTPL